MHTKNFEMRERFKQRKRELKSRIGDMDSHIEKLTEEKAGIEANLQGLKRVEEDLRVTLQSARDNIALQTAELTQKSLELSKLEQQRQAETHQLRLKLRSQVSLDDTGLEKLTGQDAPGYSHLQLVSFM